MSQNIPTVYLARHGQTEWSLSGQHTGLTDLPLTAQGEENSRRLGERLKILNFSHVFTSPLQRAVRTCELAGFGKVATLDSDLVEWNYGEYEGLRRDEILAKRPGWQLFRDGCPGGESPRDISARADRVIARVRALDGDVLLFTSGHISRVLASRWLGLNADFGRYLQLSTASLSALGDDRGQAVIRLWNEVRHLDHG